MIYIVDLEPLKERYTSWWKDYIPNEIKRNKKVCSVVSGSIMTEKVETGTVLDAAGTNWYKATQLQLIADMFYQKQIKPFDHFLVTDIWFPGIEMLRYMSQMYKIPIRIWGVWHAGSSTMNDFAQPMHPWSRHFEVGFLNLCDGIFVGSEYSKQSIIQRLLYICDEEETEDIANRIYAFGMPLDFDSLQQYSKDKEKIILFPHRPDQEKNPHIFLDIMAGLSTHWEDFEDYQFICCTSKEKYLSSDKWINALLGYHTHKTPNFKILENLSKEDYYTLVGKSSLVVSTTSEENFGYCIVEALAMGTPVLAPNAFSYPEIVEGYERILYDYYDELLDKIPKIVSKPPMSIDLKNYVKPYKYTIEKWLEIMGV